jgi:hypothetical protein
VARDVSRETCLLIEAAPLSLLNVSPAFTAQPFAFKKTMNSAPRNGAVSKFKWILLIWSLNFLQFCNQAPEKIITGSLDFSAFSNLVLGFGLFQLSS